MNILAVDDVPLVRKMIKGAVEGLDWNIIEASNGREALNILNLNAHEINVILLDWNMPEMDGIEVLAHLKGNSRYNKIPVIMTTQVNEKEKIVKAIQAGAKHYLIKPFTPQELIKKITECTGCSAPPLDRCFLGALKDSFSNVAETIAFETEAGHEEAGDGSIFYVEMLVAGKKNAVVKICMKEGTAASIVASLTGKAHTELSKKKMTEGIMDFMGSVVTRAKAMAGTFYGITIPYIRVSYSSNIRLQAEESRIVAVSRMFQAKEMEVFIYVYYLPS